MVGIVACLPFLLGGGTVRLGGPAGLGYGSGNLLLSLALVPTLLIRRAYPAVALGLGVAAAFLQLVNTSSIMTSVVVIPILVYTMARWTQGQLGPIALTAGLIGSVLGPMRWVLVPAGLSGAFGALVGTVACGGIVSAAYLAGRRRREALHSAEHRRSAAAERERLLIAEQEQRSQAADVSERNRIARELHDIVAHSLSVIVVQAEGGRALAAKRPEQAADVLGTIAETSREALEEMRRMVGVLRSRPGRAGTTAYAPSPGLDDIAELVRKTSDRAELASFGDRPRSSPALALAAYRMVQESLTNVLKHAGPGAAPGSPSPTPRTPSSWRSATTAGARDGAGGQRRPGHGLQGMHERVALHGGG